MTITGGRKNIGAGLVHLLDAARGADHHLGRLVLQLLAVLLDVDAAEEVGHLDGGHVGGEARELVADLHAQDALAQPPESCP